MKFENTDVWGFEHAIRGMRNPLESWAKSDSIFNKEGSRCLLGQNDLKLMKKLIKSGSEHRKFMRQIMVSVDITAPLYWWKEIDTYKVGTTANSTSTMHKLKDTPISCECFESDDYCNVTIDDEGRSCSDAWKMLIDTLEKLRLSFNETKDKTYWKELIRMLPESWLQKRTVTFNYENIYNMVHQRYNHKLNEWSGCDNPDKQNFIAWANSLPYANELIFHDFYKPTESVTM